jgi:hypothetical protein
VEDQWPVVCEPFTQWVLEDDFDDRPPLEDASVQLVEDVEPYELMKLRLLEGFLDARVTCDCATSSAHHNLPTNYT